jgi:D-3-phosphoglycerate dehydrogenase
MKEAGKITLINTARGELIEDYNVLADGLESGTIKRVYLDVLPDEPPSDHPLILSWRNGEDQRVVINPHSAYYSQESYIEMRQKCAQTARLFLVDNIIRNRIC